MAQQTVPQLQTLGASLLEPATAANGMEESMPALRTNP
jgi:hypothetical protein